MSTTGKPPPLAAVALGLLGLNCLSAHAGDADRAIALVMSGGWQVELWAAVAIFGCALLFLYPLVRNLPAQAPAFTQEQQGLLAQARQEVERLEALLEVRSGALQTAWLSAYEASRDTADLLGCIGSELQQQADEILSDAGEMVRTAAGNGAHENIIFSSANRLHGLVGELIAFARTGKQAQRTQPCPTTPGAWLKGLVAEAEAMAMVNGNCLDFRLAGELAPGIHADWPRLRQVVLELLHNATKFTRNGRIALEVKACLDFAEPLALVFTVRDSGKYVDPNSLERIFEPFAGTRHGDDCQGAGLAMARHWACLMDGELVAASEAGEGMTMRLTVPAEVFADGPGFHGALQAPVARLDLGAEAIPGATVAADTDMVAHLSNLVRMGAISDLIDWADSPEASSAGGARLARAVADLAGEGDLQGLSALLGDAGSGRHTAPSRHDATTLAIPSPYN